MERNKLPKHQFSILCDDVREEQGNKISIIGVYGEDIVIDTPPPTSLNKLCVLIRVIGGTGKHDVQFNLVGPNKKEMLDKSPMTLNLKPKSVGHLILHMSPFAIEKEGKYIIKIIMDGKLFHSIPFKVSVRKSQ